MSNVLADLLGASEPGFSLSLRRLERACGHPSADIRLTSEVLSRAHEAMRNLSLDPQDTTSIELYRALMLKVEQDEKKLRKQLSLADTISLDKLVPQVIKSLDQLKLPKTIWALKSTVAKSLIQAAPPKKLMKQLGYRSLDSLLKREAPAAIASAALVSEGRAWREKFYANYKRLKTTDCETRDVQLLILSGQRWQRFYARQAQLKRRLLLPVPELGSIVILPLETTVLPGAALALLLSLVYHINKLRSISAQVKLEQVKPQFGLHAVAIWRGRTMPIAYIANQPLYFDTVRRYLAGHSAAMFPELFDPHLQMEDVQYSEPEAALVGIDPDFAFWQKVNPSGMSGKEGPVSLNALDAAVNYCNKLSFERRSLSFLQEALNQELLLRYLHSPLILDRVMRQLESEPVRQQTMMGSFA